MCGFEKLQAAVLDEGDISSCELNLKLGAMVGGTEQDCLALEIDTGFTVLQNLLTRARCFRLCWRPLPYQQTQLAGDGTTQ